MNQNGFIGVALVILVVILAGATAYLAFFNNQKSPVPSSITPSPPPPTSLPQRNILEVSLGQQFTLKKNQVAKIGGTGLEVEIEAFYNSPCPPGVYCGWSGVGIAFTYRLNGQVEGSVVEGGVKLVWAFGYETTIIKTDYETYADLVVKKTLL